MSPRRRRAVVEAVLGILLLQSCSSGGASIPFVRLSGPMPQISGPSLNGAIFGPTDYAGKIVVVNFWNQDCPPCREEMPLLEQDSEALARRGVIVIGVLYVGGNWPNDLSAARTFLTAVGVSYPTIVDSSSRMAQQFGIAGIPTTVVADRFGNLRFEVLGKVPSGQLELFVNEMEQSSSPIGSEGG